MITRILGWFYDRTHATEKAKYGDMAYYFSKHPYERSVYDGHFSAFGGSQNKTLLSFGPANNDDRYKELNRRGAQYNPMTRTIDLSEYEPVVDDPCDMMEQFTLDTNYIKIDGEEPQEVSTVAHKRVSRRTKKNV